VTIGTVNMTEFAYSGIGLNPHYGTPRNPHDPKVARSPGGSSSGSAVAVATGLAPVAIGTDTSGSIRVPASFNGVTGYKSSTGRYPMAGVFPLSRTLDSLGPLANTVEDCVLVDAALRGSLVPETCRLPVADLPLIVPETLVLDGCEPAVLANFEAAIDRSSLPALLGPRAFGLPFPVEKQRAGRPPLERPAPALSGAPCRPWPRSRNSSRSTGTYSPRRHCTCTGSASAAPTPRASTGAWSNAS
jgi:aspartyl-tRNA(Asn)/glutamyl-tRNA(Gln) amidotransferase subunit A